MQSRWPRVRGFLRNASITLIALYFSLPQAKSQAVHQSPTTQQHEWRNFTTTNSDLPSGGIWALAVGADDALWIATSRGLVRFHEGIWQVFTPVNSGLPSNGVSVLAATGDGAFWVGIVGGLARFHEGVWQDFTAANSELPGKDIRSLAVTTDGALWIGTSRGLARFHEGTWQAFTSTNSELPDNTISSLAATTDGALWIGTYGGLARFHKGAWQVFTADDIGLPGDEDTAARLGLPRDSITAIATGADNALWVGILGGIARFRGGVWEVFTTANSDLPDSIVPALAVTADGTLWIGTSRGLARFHEGTWQVFTTANSVLPDGFVHSLAVAADGALWINTNGDKLSRLHEGSWQVFTDTNSDLPSSIVPALTASADDAMWFGTLGGLARFHEGDWQVFTPANSGLPYDNVDALAATSDGTLWIGTFRGGLARFHEGVWQVFTAANSGLPSDTVRALAAASDGVLWIGTDRGLARFHEGTWHVLTEENSDLPDSTVPALAVTTDGTLWVGTLGGLARFHEGDWQVFTAANSGLPYDNVEALAVATDGALWIGTYKGLARFHEGDWQVFTAANSKLPGDNVWSLAEATDGALWIGTFGGGLARLHQGDWQVFTPINSGLPHNMVEALAVAADGSLWIGTNGGLARFQWRAPRPLLSKVQTLANIHQREHTFAVRGFDPSYRTANHRLRYYWQVNRRDRLATKTVLTQRTSQPYLTVRFPEDGFYVIAVRAVDRYGWTSEPENFDVEVELSGREDQSWWQLSTLRLGIAAILLTYLVLLLPLVSFYSQYSFMRSMVNSGVFAKFPILHRLLLNTSWARRHVFALYCTEIGSTPDIAHYINQSVFPLSDGKSIFVGSESDLFGIVTDQSRFSIILGRSGTGKSILMSQIRHRAAARFGQAYENLPVLLNAPTHLANGESVVDAVKSALRRDGKVELPDEILNFLLRKGGFLILVDSLNECPQAAVALTSFLNEDANNVLVVASQTDDLQHPDTAAYRLAEVTVEQARSYLDIRIKAGTWDRLSPTLQALTRNPKDLDLIAEIMGKLDVEDLPSHRADLYAARLRADSALDVWIDNADRRLGIMYGLAYRMLSERRVLGLPILAQWLSDELSAQHLQAENVGEIIEVLRRSRQFRGVKAQDRLGREEDAITFDHELIGKFLAARHMPAMLTSTSREEALQLATDESWQDVFCFVVDEVEVPKLPKLLLEDLIEQGGVGSLAIVAYAIKTKSEERLPLPPEIREKYNDARLMEDVKLTPANRS